MATIAVPFHQVIQVVTQRLPLALWTAANLEEDWQAERWGHDDEAAERRARRREAFLAAAEFAALARG